MFRSERGSVPLALIVMVILLTTSTALAGYVIQEISATRHNQESIQARYVAEAGAEHFLYEVKQVLRGKTWPVSDAYDPGENPADYLTKNEVDTLLGTSQTLENVGSYQASEVELYDAAGTTPVPKCSIALPYGTDSFQVEFKITASDVGQKKLTRSLKVRAKFSVHLEEVSGNLRIYFYQNPPQPVITFQTWEWR